MARKNYARSDRVASQIQRELAEAIRLELKDPRLGLVTITEVEVTRDYAHAKIYYTVLGTDDAARALAQSILQEASGMLRSVLARHIRLFSVPQLHFVYDESIERGQNMQQLLAQVAADDAKLPDNPWTENE